MTSKRSGNHVGQLSAVQLPRYATGPRKTYLDGAGLYFSANGNSGAAWVFRYTRNDKTHNLGLGPWPEVELGSARERAFEQRKLLSKGIDPLEHKVQAKRLAASKTAARLTYEQLATEYFDEHVGVWKQGTWYARKLRQKNYAIPAFGKKWADEIDTDDLIKLLTPLFAPGGKIRTAHHLRQEVEAILAWASIYYRKWFKFSEGANPARWLYHLSAVFKHQAKAHIVVNRRALSYSKAPELIARLRDLELMPARALEFQILTASRPSAALGARWDEIDWNNATWTIPPERAKWKPGTDRRSIIVPLSSQAIALLRQMQQPWRTKMQLRVLAAYGAAADDPSMCTAVPRGMHAHRAPGPLHTKIAAITGVDPRHVGWIIKDEIKKRAAPPSEFIFPTQGAGNPGKRGGKMCIVNFNNLLKRLGCDCNPHGFRGTFQKWRKHEHGPNSPIREKNNGPVFGWDLGELQLGHVVGSITERAYGDDQLVEQRRPMVQAWADYLDGSAAPKTATNDDANVVRFHKQG